MDRRAHSTNSSVSVALQSILVLVRRPAVYPFPDSVHPVVFRPVPRYLSPLLSQHSAGQTQQRAQPELPSLLGD